MKKIGFLVSILLPLLLEKIHKAEDPQSLPLTSTMVESDLC
jgi:hypothetical protein